MLSLLPMVVLTNCVAPTTRTPPPAPPPPVTIAPPPVVTPPGPPTDTGVEPGLWIYSGDSHGTTARFGMTPQVATLAIQCDRTIRAVSLLVARTGSPGGTVLLRATSMVKSFSAEGGGPYAVVRIPPRDPILDAISFSRGRFGVAIDGVERAYPAWPEFTRVVEDCRG